MQAAGTGPVLVTARHLLSGEDDYTFVRGSSGVPRGPAPPGPVPGYAWGLAVHRILVPSASGDSVKQSLTPAVIGMMGVLLGGFVTAVTAAFRERVGRRDQAQQEALYALQDACLANRRAYQALFAAQADSTSRSYQAAAGEVDHTLQVLDLTEARVLCDQVLERVAAWRRVVKPALLRDDVRDVSAAEEDVAWKAIQVRVRQELRWLSSRRIR